MKKLKFDIALHRVIFRVNWLSDYPESTVSSFFEISRHNSSNELICLPGIWSLSLIVSLHNSALLLYQPKEPFNKTKWINFEVTPNLLKHEVHHSKTLHSDKYCWHQTWILPKLFIEKFCIIHIVIPITSTIFQQYCCKFEHCNYETRISIAFDESLSFLKAFYIFKFNVNTCSLNLRTWAIA